MSDLNPNALKWVEALESGDYKQTTGVLTRVSEDGTATHCCLGVACDLAIKNGVPLTVTERGDANAGHTRYYKGEGEEDAQHALLPDAVRQWLGLSTVDSSFYPEDDDGYGEQLTALNDAGTSFEDIAAIIRSKPKGLFAS